MDQSNSSRRSFLKNVSFATDVSIKEEKQLRDYHNVFRYLGKISNLPLLMKIIPVKTHPVLSVPVESFDYVSFKKMQQKKTE